MGVRLPNNPSVWGSGGAPHTAGQLPSGQAAAQPGHGVVIKPGCPCCCMRPTTRPPVCFHAAGSQPAGRQCEGCAGGALPHMYDLCALGSVGALHGAKGAGRYDCPLKPGASCHTCARDGGGAAVVMTAVLTMSSPRPPPLPFPPRAQGVWYGGPDWAWISQWCGSCKQTLDPYCGAAT